MRWCKIKSVCQTHKRFVHSWSHDLVIQDMSISLLQIPWWKISIVSSGHHRWAGWSFTFRFDWDHLKSPHNSIYQKVEAVTKSWPFGRRHFQFHFFSWNCYILFQLYWHMLIRVKVTIIQYLPRSSHCDVQTPWKPLSEPMTARFMYYLISMGEDKARTPDVGALNPELRRSLLCIGRARPWVPYTNRYSSKKRINIMPMIRNYTRLPTQSLKLRLVWLITYSTLD